MGVGCQLLSGGADLRVGATSAGGAGAAPSGGAGGEGGQGGQGGGGAFGGAGGAGGGSALDSPCADVDALAVRLFGSDGEKVVNDIAAHPAGGCVIVGTFDADLPALGLVHDATHSQGFVARLDGEGEVAWGLPLEIDGRPTHDARRVVVAEGGAIHVAGAFTEEAFVARVGENAGVPTLWWWAELVPEVGGAVEVNDLAVDPSATHRVWLGGACVGQLQARDRIANTLQTVSTLNCPEAGAGFILSIQEGLNPSWRHGTQVIASAGAAVRAVDARWDGATAASLRVAAVGTITSGNVIVDTATVGTCASDTECGFFVTFGVTGETKLGLTARVLAGDAHVGATAVALLRAPDRLVIGGQFAPNLVVDFTSGMVASHTSSDVNGFLVQYDVSTATPTPIQGSLVHLGGDAAGVVVTDVVASDDTPSSLFVAGMFTGAFLGRASTEREPFVVSVGRDGTPTLLLHVAAASGSDAPGLDLDADGRLLLGATIRSTWQLDGGPTFEVPTGAKGALVLSFAPR